MSDGSEGGRGSIAASSGSVPSAYDFSAHQPLADRGIIPGPAQTRPRLSEKEPGGIIYKLLTSKIDCDPLQVDNLARAFGEPCPDENAFVDGTFKAFVGCFQSSSLWSLVDSGQENLMILKKGGTSGQNEDAAGRNEGDFTVTVTSRVRDPAEGKHMYVTGRYAIGLARQMAVPTQNRGLFEAETFPDHAWVVVWKKGQETSWGVCQVLSTVEVTFEDKACERLPIAENGCLDPYWIDLRKNGGCVPLGHEILYVFGHVLWGRAALALPLPESIPFAVVSGEKKREEASKGMLTDGQMPPLALKSQQDSRKARWVHGSLYISRECGGDFTYTVDSFGWFCETSGDSALAAYLDVMMEGFDAGIALMERMQSNKKAGVPDGNLFWSSAMTGRELCFGQNCILEWPDMKVMGTPVRMHGNLRIDGELVATQGELFCRLINLSELRAQVSAEEDVFWCSGYESQQEVLNGPVSVIVKVASSSCHTRLHQPGVSLLGQLTKRSLCWWEETSKYLLPSLYAVYVIPTPTAQQSVIQLMPNFKEMGYIPVCPANVVEKVQMCQAFRSLLEGTLLPLAQIGIIHADLRAGYGTTANILYHPNEHVMRLIDLDSLMFFNEVKTLLKDKRLIAPKNGLQARQISSALEYVLLQAVCVASVWSSRTNEVTTELIIESYWKERDRNGALKVLESKESAGSHILGEFDKLVAPFLKNEKKL